MLLLVTMQTNSAARGHNEQPARRQPTGRRGIDQRCRENETFFAGGELINIYERDGEDGVLKFADEKMTSILYNEGREPQLIKMQDYVKWKKGVVCRRIQYNKFR